jgi:hypothetical protein
MTLLRGSESTPSEGASAGGSWTLRWEREALRGSRLRGARKARGLRPIRNAPGAGTESQSADSDRSIGDDPEGERRRCILDSMRGKQGASGAHSARPNVHGAGHSAHAGRAQPKEASGSSIRRQLPAALRMTGRPKLPPLLSSIYRDRILRKTSQPHIPGIRRGERVDAIEAQLRLYTIPTHQF